MSVVTAGVPSPSTIEPPVITRSYGACACAADPVHPESRGRTKVRIQIMIRIPNL